MRKHYETIFKNYFHTILFRTRCELNLSQETMAEKLAMATRSYVDLDHGKTNCSSTTLALFLIYLCDDPLAFLDNLRQAFENGNDQAA